MAAVAEWFRRKVVALVYAGSNPASRPRRMDYDKNRISQKVRE